MRQPLISLCVALTATAAHAHETGVPHAEEGGGFDLQAGLGLGLLGAVVIAVMVGLRVLVARTRD